MVNWNNMLVQWNPYNVGNSCKYVVLQFCQYFEVRLLRISYMHGLIKWPVVLFWDELYCFSSGYLQNHICIQQRIVYEYDPIFDINFIIHNNLMK